MKFIVILPILKKNISLLLPFTKTNLENTIMCIAPTKAFNMAGMQTACIVVANEVLRHKVNRGINTDEVAEPNSFAIVQQRQLLIKVKIGLMN